MLMEIGKHKSIKSVVPWCADNGVEQSRAIYSGMVPGAGQVGDIVQGQKQLDQH